MEVKVKGEVKEQMVELIEVEQMVEVKDNSDESGGKDGREIRFKQKREREHLPRRYLATHLVFCSLKCLHT